MTKQIEELHLGATAPVEIDYHPNVTAAKRRLSRGQGVTHQVPQDAVVENVSLPRFKELTGFTPKAIYGKIARGDWMEGFEFHRSPTGAITVYLPGYHRWARGEDRIHSTAKP